MPSVGGGAKRLWREIGDERLLASLNSRRIRAVEEKPADERVDSLTERKPRIHDRVDDPAADDQRASSKTIGQHPATHRDQCLDRVLSAPEQRESHQRNARL